ncbi:MAG: TetR/AcrR family transcriptional regulator [Byssovorax sp.]
MGKAERRQELLRAAREVFSTKGYHDAKIDDIVAIARVAKGTFYLYFADKRSIFVELVDTLFQRIGAAILKVDTRSDVEEQVKHNIRAIVAALLDDPALTKILFSYAAGLDPAFVQAIRSFYDGSKALLEASLVEGQALGIVAPGDARLFATFTLGALKELLFENVTAEKALPREEIVHSLFTFLQGGYLRIGPTAPVTRPPSTPPAAKKKPRARSTPQS